MFRFLGILFLSLGVAAPVAAQQDSLGIFSQWGAFRDARRCYAVAQPEGPRPDGAFAAVSWWPGTGVRGQVHFRLDRGKRQGSALLLRIDARTFQLIGGGEDAWAPDARADAEIVAAMRTGIDMSLETRAEGGALIRNLYRLRGAASAMDAAAIGCARR
ncbi:MAG: hypothetical protein JOZ90_14530 [Alphaproteobacteria bacterium]|nr:hypothetical protein [Alphaproteobacteria bacterium]MBV9371903.1 hypothetical protein [Alphaproteobacteria bacterium]MBV9902289.1 hypothetical protein [Alphaproteobacteria bacterium]